jgi:hypothetical protein
MCSAVTRVGSVDSVLPNIPHEELLPGSQPRECRRHFSRVEITKRDQLSSQIGDPDRLAHTQHHHLARLPNHSLLNHVARRFRNGHEEANDVQVGHGDRTTLGNLFLELRDDAATGTQHVAKSHCHDTGASVLLGQVTDDQLGCACGFLVLGHGSDSARLKAAAQSRQVDKVVFFEEIDPDEITELYAQCEAGIVALVPRHKSNNIPGKFLTYMQSGLPVLANINAGNDLVQTIRNERVGQVCEANQVDELLTEKLLDQTETDSGLSARCTDMFERQFAVENNVVQIMAALSVTKVAR